MKSLVENVHFSLDWIAEAEEAFTQNKIQLSLLKYALAGEVGYETAQSNSAYILEQKKRKFELKSVFSLDSDELDVAFNFWNRAANQNNVDASIKLGDYYFYNKGLKYVEGKRFNNKSETNNEYSLAKTIFYIFGIMKHSILKNYEISSVYYQIAADSERSALAMWNLGWMYEYGIGVEKDYHLAKRWYDSSQNHSPQAFLPIKIALLKVRVKLAFEDFKNMLFVKPETEVEDDNEPEKLSTLESDSTFVENSKSNYQTLFSVFLGLFILFLLWKRQGN